MIIFKSFFFWFQQFFSCDFDFKCYKLHFEASLAAAGFLVAIIHARKGVPVFSKWDSFKGKIEEL